MSHDIPLSPEAKRLGQSCPLAVTSLVSSLYTCLGVSSHYAAATRLASIAASLFCCSLFNCFGLEVVGAS